MVYVNRIVLSGKLVEQARHWPAREAVRDADGNLLHAEQTPFCVFKIDTGANPRFQKGSSARRQSRLLMRCAARGRTAVGMEKLAPKLGTRLILWGALHVYSRKEPVTGNTRIYHTLQAEGFSVMWERRSTFIKGHKLVPVSDYARFLALEKIVSEWDLSQEAEETMLTLAEEFESMLEDEQEQGKFTEANDSVNATQEGL